MPPAARLNDSHSCPRPQAHAGGPISSGSGSVIIEGQNAARVGDTAICVGDGTDTITSGSATVVIDGAAAARMGDPTAHGGKITSGAGTVIIGDTTWSTGAFSGVPIDPIRDHFVEVRVTWLDGMPLAGERCIITVPGGQVFDRRLDEKGWARIAGIDEGTCKIEVPKYGITYLAVSEEERVF